MRILTEKDGFPSLGTFDIGLMRKPGRASSAVDALARHVAESLGNLSSGMIAAEYGLVEEHSAEAEAEARSFRLEVPGKDLDGREDLRHVPFITIDGVRVEYADGFGLARPSNTTPVIVLRFEADNEAAIKRIQADFRKALQQVV